MKRAATSKDIKILNFGSQSYIVKVLGAPDSRVEPFAISKDFKPNESLIRMLPLEVFNLSPEAERAQTNLLRLREKAFMD